VQSLISALSIVYVTGRVRRVYIELLVFNILLRFLAYCRYFKAVHDVRNALVNIIVPCLTDLMLC
jgi:hypothetical protein